MMPFRTYILLIFIFLHGRSLAQAIPPLDRLISVDIRSATLDNALRQISQAGHFEFSYSPAAIAGNAPVTVRLTKTPVREVLNRLFQSRVVYKTRGNHIILMRNDAPALSPKNFFLDGYILDEQTGERIAQASIFEKTTLASTVSNPFGYYRLRLSTDLPTVRLDVRKQAYAGETVLVRSRFSHSISIRMTPLPPQLPLETLPIRVTEDTIRPTGVLATVPVELPSTSPDSTPSKPASMLEKGRQGVTKLFVSAQQIIHDVNLSRDTLYRNWQVSFLPFIGTNHRLSGRISNRISVNTLIGYSFGVRAVEVGGLLNLVRSDVQGFQAGGLGNLVGGQVKGVQLGGLFNVDGGELLNAFQVAGLLNIAGKSVQGVQLAGLVNYTPQAVKGWQIGGILNRARTVRGGHQIGLINLADSSGSVPIGLISHVQKGGFRRVELGSNEVNLLNITYRTGVRQLYNIITAGTSFEREGSPKLSTGYGLGTAFVLSKASLFTMEATYHLQFYVDRRPFTSWNNQIRLSTLIEAKLSKQLSVAVGPSINWYFGNDGIAPPLLQPSVSLFAGRTDTFGDTRHWGWVGFQAGLRFGNS